MPPNKYCNTASALQLMVSFTFNYIEVFCFYIEHGFPSDQELIKMMMTLINILLYFLFFALHDVVQ